VTILNSSHTGDRADASVHENTIPGVEPASRLRYLVLTHRRDVEMQNGPWFPPFWPGWFFGIASGLSDAGKRGNQRMDTVLAMMGNATFYSWIFFRFIKADVAWRGRIRADTSFNNICVGLSVMIQIVDCAL
jgi:hypothetical protein